jgi:hypothetical protein
VGNPFHERKKASAACKDYGSHLRLVRQQPQSTSVSREVQKELVQISTWQLSDRVVSLCWYMFRSCTKVLGSEIIGPIQARREPSIVVPVGPKVFTDRVRIFISQGVDSED